MSRSRSVFRFAKKKFLECQCKLKRTVKNVSKTSNIVLDEPILEEIFKKLDIKDRVMFRNLSPHIHDLIDRLPLILPFVFIRSDSRGNIELQCDHMDVLLGYILVDIPSFKVNDGVMVFSYSNARTVITSIVSRITGIAHLWLDSTWNGYIVQTIVEYYQAINHDNKRKRSLILTGIDGLEPDDLFRMTNESRLEELAVVGELIKPSIFDRKEAGTMLETVNSLLIQVDSSFSIHDVSEREAILRMMSSLPISGVLEVIHVSRGTVTDTTKVINYWIQLARDSSREVKLKLEECSQERADAAVGRLLRKVRGIGRGEWTKGGVSMQMGDGRLTVLDKRTWFGDDQ
ncbi:F-box domain protein [Dictyocaulus viviparus]|uniref:F-box domain protein n=1 Tax=Dictyocaulus viviparus TaxID=29172 RepID=A0A0D8XVT3_DICVI|nr:F-box domain protein [Dictyocaulus viviparus]